MIKISYLVPLYNKENFIVECIESILSEKTNEIDIEVCIVNDGSTDNSLEIVNNYYKNNNMVKIGSFPSNKGKNAACNEAFLLATGDFICLFGADDVLVKGRTKKLYEKGFGSGKAVYGGLIAKNEDLSEDYYSLLPKVPSLYSITMGNGLSGGCCLIPRNLFQTIFPIPENLKFEDWWISYNLVKNDNVIILMDYVTIYRIGTQNDCGSFGGDLYLNIKKDYVRHFDCLKLFKETSNNSFLDKSVDLRRAFLGQKTKKILYLKPFDFFSLKILMYKIFGAKKIYSFYQHIKKTK